MICTEAEAREKWCPHKRIAYYNETEPVTAVNVDEDGDAFLSTCCIGSDCMMWVWFSGGHEGSCGLSRG